MTTYCTHHDCRLDAVQELQWMATRLKRIDIGLQAVDLAARPCEVRCRRDQPRPAHTNKNSPMPPLPERRGA